MAARSRRSSPSLLLLVILLTALAVGAAASLLLSARSAGPPPPAGPSHGILFPAWAVGAAIVALFAALAFPLVYGRLSQPAGRAPSSFLLVAVSLLLAILVFVVLTHLFAFSNGGFTTSGSGPPGNNSSKGNPPPNGTPSSVPGSGGNLVPFNPHLPSWTLFVAVALVLVAVAVAGMPRLSEYLEDRRLARDARRRAGQVAGRLQRALRQAARQLDGGGDARQAILSLYAELLARIEPLVTDLDRVTPEEIRVLHLTRLGVRQMAAEDLTRTFEEARYSSHPISGEAVERARRAIRWAEADLQRAAGPE